MKMKNENKDLLDLKLEIIDNGSTIIFQEIALLIDKPEYLRLIDKIRGEYNLYKPELTDNADYFDLVLMFDRSKRKSINLLKYKSLKRFKETLPKNYDDVMTFSKDCSGMIMAQAEAMLICFEFGRPFYFVPIILQSILCSDVDCKYLQHTKAVLYDDNDALFRDLIKSPKVVIEVSPHTTDEQVKQARKESKKIFDTDPRFKYLNKKPDYINEIKKYRYWYWKRLTGIKYVEIAKDWDKMNSYSAHCSTHQHAIMKGVKKYIKLLKM